MNLYSYVVARDYGFAPNPFYRFCTLATCKPQIRQKAQIGDWVVGTGSKANDRQDHIVYAMRVTEVMTFDDYWRDHRFFHKKPRLQGSTKQLFGDNIYHRTSNSDPWIQEDSHHSHKNGGQNHKNIKRDTQANRILVSNDYIYWGGGGPKIPQRFRNYKGVDLCARRGYKKNFPPGLIQEVVAWLESQSERGYLSEPFNWIRSATWN